MVGGGRVEKEHQHQNDLESGPGSTTGCPVTLFKPQSNPGLHSK